jgi:hypothetical protein
MSPRFFVDKTGAPGQSGLVDFAERAIGFVIFGQDSVGSFPSISNVSEKPSEERKRTGSEA